MILEKSLQSVETEATDSTQNRSIGFRCNWWMQTLLGPTSPVSVPGFSVGSDYRKNFGSCLTGKSAIENEFFDQWWKQKETLYFESIHDDESEKSKDFQIDSDGSIKNEEPLNKRGYLGFILNSNKSFFEESDYETICKLFKIHLKRISNEILTPGDQKIPLFDLSKKNSKCVLPSVDFPEKSGNSPTDKIFKLKHLFALVHQFYSSENLNRACFERLSRVEHKILFFLLKKLFPIKMSKNEATFALLETLKNLTSKKRNEEKIKQIWKRFLRKIYDEYKKKTEKLNCENTRKNKSCDKWREFYEHMFQDLVQNESQKYNFDLVMDICTEKTVRLINQKRPRELSRENNWSSLGRISAMKKIPASFRYLVSQSRVYSEKFRRFLCLENKEGILELMREIIKTKLQNLFCQWEAKFKSLGQEDFLKYVEMQIKNKKFKLPWLLSNVKDSIEYCVRDIDNAKLTKKFEIIRQNHYTFKGFNGSKSK